MINTFNSIFYISLISTVLVLGVLLRLIHLYISQKSLKVLVISNGLIVLSMLILNIALVISHISVVLPQYAPLEEAIYAVAYSLYLGTWIVGFNYFMSKIVRIPPHRRLRFNIATKSLNILLLGMVVLSVLTSGLIKSFSEREDFSELVEMAFAIVSQIALVIFIYFYSSLGTEIEQNSSKLIKARLQLMRYAIIGQILVSVSIAIGSIFLVFSSVTANTILFFLFNSMIFFTVLSTFILMWSIQIPNILRVRFNLTPKRFEFVIRARG